MLKKISLLCALCLCLVVFLFGCSTPEDDSSYTLQEDGKTYLLELSQDTSTFVLTEGEERYTGSFTKQDGYFVLQNSSFGYKTVILTGDTFSFVKNPEGLDEKQEEQPSVCSHVWVQEKYTVGTCSTYGFTTYRCSLCNETKIVSDTAYGTSHDFTETHVDGSCITHGYTQYVCTRCGFKEKKEDDFFPDIHRYELTSVIKDDGCLSNVSLQYKCQDCDNKKYEQADYIGSHCYDTFGVCENCHYAKNGLSCNTHPDLDEDGLCDECGVSVAALNALKTQVSYSDGSLLYFGAYPQAKYDYSAETIRLNGRYDKNLDYYYYQNETFALGTCKNSSVTFTGEISGERNKEYVFIVQPLTWEKATDTGKYVCKNIIGSARFLDDVYMTESDGKKYTTLLSGAYANDYNGSSIKQTLNAIYRKAFTTAQKKVMEGSALSLPSIADIYLLDTKKVLTDFALLDNNNTLFRFQSKTYGDWWLSEPSSELTSAVQTETYNGIISATVTSYRGIVPTFTLRQTN